MTAYPDVTHPALGTLRRSSFTLTDGETQYMESYAGEIDLAGTAVELLVESSDPAVVEKLSERLAAALAQLPRLVRRATDAIVAEFSDQDPTEADRDEAARDLALQTLAVLPDGRLVLHLDDTTSTHFPEGRWPAVYLGGDNEVLDVTVEA
ncbi:hypothetical protein ACF07D_11445 [Leucobacter sp. NPDC015123]|uniref:hypothetical protein n=1 Tax=Leucobacter sp. NPDC015123 TaxID=3364129 RepID=UPI0036F47101